MKSPSRLTVQELLCDLISIPSVTPEGDSGGSKAGEAAIGEYVTNYLASLGSEVISTEVQPGRPNVVARFPASTPGAPVFALVPHLDTVGVAGMTIRPFTPESRSGRIYGRGASDTKGPMAAALWALGDHLQSTNRDRSKVTWVFAATMGEEELSTGASALCQQGFKADFAIALEPTDRQIVHASKGVLRLWAKARGHAAHGATPERGENAIFKLLPFIKECQGLHSQVFATNVHPVLGPASLNLGVIRGGTELNIVPDECSVGLDIRTHPRLDMQAALAHIQAIALGLEIELHRSGPPFVLDANISPIRDLRPHALGTSPAAWFSDANVFNANGIPSVAFGPGKMAQAHTKDEFILEADLEIGASAFKHYIESTSSDPRL